jgi:hypothetical protein
VASELPAWLHEPGVKRAELSVNRDGTSVPPTLLARREVERLAVDQPAAPMDGVIQVCLLSWHNHCMHMLSWHNARSP